MFSNIGVPELLIIFLVILLLFGARRIPEIAQGLGRGIKDFKKAMRDTTNEVTRSTEVEKPAKTNSSDDKKE